MATRIEMSQPLHVLFVEDAEDDVLLITRALRRGGLVPMYERVDTAAAMCAALDRQAWDVIIADYFMPNFSAPEALKLLKERGLDIPFIIVSGSVGEERAVAAMKAGAHDYLMKGSLARLAPTVERELREAVERRERKRVEQALGTTEARFASILEIAAEAIIIIDQENGIALFNKSAEQIFGYTAAEMIGQPLSQLLPAYPDNPVRDDVRVAGIYEGQHLLVQGRRKNGTEFPAEVSISSLAQHDRTTVIVILQDITERKSLEAQLQQMQKMDSIGRLAGGVAHDFNNLLTAIMGYADLGRLTTPIDSPLYSDLEQIRKAAKRAATLTHQLLAFARRQVIEPRVFNLNDLILDMDNMLRRLIGADVELVTLLDPTLGMVRADPSQLEQVVINLVINARDAMPNGGKLTITTTNSGFDHDYARQYLDTHAGTCVVFSVSDTGIGMDAEVQQHVFEPFFTTKEQGKGTGLGLATCYGIVRQSGGHIECSAVPSGGATFNIYLPRVEEAASPFSQREEMSSLVQGTETVLVVEDEPAVRVLATRVLREQGYIVLEATNGEEALSLMWSKPGRPIHLVLTDVVMPKMGGAALVEHLVVRYPEIKILFTSGYPHNAHIQSDSFGIDVAFLPKPFTTIDLTRKVREVLDG